MVTWAAVEQIEGSAVVGLDCHVGQATSLVGATGIVGGCGGVVMATAVVEVSLETSDEVARWYPPRQMRLSVEVNAAEIS